ncbi:CLUMA_CG013571, isoform A [Clunio marinus]|uniref:CLUMA_CG013571, isoform A n=1 Tax=Clunio marinus TaxID=568069 RepID=A0A1J1IKK7_9DIPT|nr:CLUMA_CG013571, isoform A [Clunio marinus]
MHSNRIFHSSQRSNQGKSIQVKKDNSFLRIGSLRIGSLLGVNTKIPQSPHHQQIRSNRVSAPPSSFDIKLHKNWGSADNVLPHSGQETMGPPKYSVKKRRQKRDLPDFPLPMMECHSMPTTPNLEGRHKSTDGSSDHDSDSNYGFDNNWGS